MFFQNHFDERNHFHSCSYLSKDQCGVTHFFWFPSTLQQKASTVKLWRMYFSIRDCCRAFVSVKMTESAHDVRISHQWGSWIFHRLKKKEDTFFQEFNRPQKKLSGILQTFLWIKKTQMHFSTTVSAFRVTWRAASLQRGSAERSMVSFAPSSAWSSNSDE